MKEYRFAVEMYCSLTYRMLHLGYITGKGDTLDSAYANGWDNWCEQGKNVLTKNVQLRVASETENRKEGRYS